MAVRDLGKVLRACQAEPEAILCLHVRDALSCALFGQPAPALPMSACWCAQPLTLPADRERTGQVCAHRGHDGPHGGGRYQPQTSQDEGRDELRHGGFVECGVPESVASSLWHRQCPWPLSLLAPTCDSPAPAPSPRRFSVLPTKLTTRWTPSSFQRECQRENASPFRGEEAMPVGGGGDDDS